MNYLTECEKEITEYFSSHKIPEDFRKCFLREFVNIFGGDFMVPDKDYLAEYDDDGNVINSNEDDYSYEDQINYCLLCFGGTAGWHKAFKKACEQTGATELYDYYSKLDWVRSDIFDGFIADDVAKMILSDNDVNSKKGSNE